MKDKYYTPDIEEFHIGFEYEYFAHPNYTIDSDIDVKDKVWLKSDDFTDFDDYDNHGIDVVNYYINKDEIRVKYLDKEDIESLGFTYVDHNWDFARQYIGGSLNYIMSTDNEYYFLRTWSDGVIRISKHNVKEVENSYRLFEGIIKNKSELKRVLKQIGIDYEKTN